MKSLQQIREIQQKISLFRPRLSTSVQRRWSLGWVDHCLQFDSFYIKFLCFIMSFCAHILQSILSLQAVLLFISQTEWALQISVRQKKKKSKKRTVIPNVLPSGTNDRLFLSMRFHVTDIYNSVVNICSWILMSHNVGFWYLQLRRLWQTFPGSRWLASFCNFTSREGKSGPQVIISILCNDNHLNIRLKVKYEQFFFSTFQVKVSQLSYAQAGCDYNHLMKSFTSSKMQIASVTELHKPVWNSVILFLIF